MCKSSFVVKRYPELSSEQWLAEYDPWAISIFWGLVRDANSQALAQTCRTRNTETLGVHLNRLSRGF